MNLLAAPSQTVSQAAVVLGSIFGEAKTLGESLEMARAWLTVAVLWTGFQAMKFAATPIQM